MMRENETCSKFIATESIYPPVPIPSRYESRTASDLM